MGVFIRDEASFMPILQQLKWNRKVIVTLNGCFDILHAAHVRLLQHAGTLGDILIVGLNSDASVKRIKGEPKPFLDIAQRAKNVSSFDCVDYVMEFDEDIPCLWLDKIRPDIHVNDVTYGLDCVEAPILNQYGGKLHLVEKYPDITSSDIAKTIWEKWNEHGGPTS